MDKAGSYTDTTGGQGGGYNQEDKYEKEKKVSREKSPLNTYYSTQDMHFLGLITMSQKREFSLSELHERDGHHEEAPPSKPGQNVRNLRRQAALLHYSGRCIRFLLKITVIAVLKIVIIL